MPLSQHAGQMLSKDGVKKNEISYRDEISMQSQ